MSYLYEKGAWFGVELGKCPGRANSPPFTSHAFICPIDQFSFFVMWQREKLRPTGDQVLVGVLNYEILARHL